ncbi:MAG TPA: LysR substrate-binding domain-containing protein [Bradyrhizobium sp.]|uniref:LysR substrate-binding domain-containing protein n=1 Tax=Bradyrhizobium sp. TaxID=376 RepID=UPI002D7E542A|nr:LysR substrate-binding domain-containing protein [Bradyrhizobium sp.]HET7887856.1 LysR substrate-binding domain-containing protein [Bradyrhizobium sp.]
MQTLDLAILRTLLAAVESGSFAAAARRVGRSESAVSLQLKRLEEQIGEPLFVRSGRQMAPTGAGARLVDYARQLLALNDEALSSTSQNSIDGTVSLGVPHDVAETWLPAVIAGFRRSHPSATLEVTEGRSALLQSRLIDNQIDLAVVFSASRPASALWSANLPMVWIGRSDFALNRNEPVRLAAFDPPCFFRAAATTSLDRADIDWSIGYISNTLPDLWSAVKLGLGVAVRTPAALPSGLSVLDGRHGLPDLPPFQVSLCGPPGPSMRPIIASLRTILEDCLAVSIDAAA